MLHLWVGGVVVDEMVRDGQHHFLLRENREIWVPVSDLTRIAYKAVNFGMLSMCSIALLWSLWNWLPDVKLAIKNR